MYSGAARKTLTPLEQSFMNYVWQHPDSTAEMCRAGAGHSDFRESTVRTILKNLEKKGYVTHEVRGRTFHYRAIHSKRNVAIDAARQLITRFCGGSVKEFVVGMVDNQMIKPNDLKEIAEEIASRRRKKS
jgi:predicted transcriptional regulator